MKTKKLAVIVTAAALSYGCGQRSEVEEQVRQSAEQVPIKEDAEVQSREVKEPEGPKDLSTDISKVVLYNGTKASAVNTNEPIAEHRIKPWALGTYWCGSRGYSNDVTVIAFDHILSALEGWGGVVFDVDCVYKFNLAHYNSLSLKISPKNIDKIRIEAQMGCETRGDTYRDEIPFCANGISDISVDIRKLTKGNLRSVSELKLVVDSTYLNSRKGALVVYDMRLK